LFGDTQGDFTFNGTATAGNYLGPGGQILSTPGNEYADFMLGQAYSYSELEVQTMPAYLVNNIGLWFGGWEFDTPHPVFAGLPAPVVFGQEFAAAFAYWGIIDFPGKLIAGLINAPPQVAVTLGELPFGKSKIMVCSLDLLPYLDKDPVADRILAQLLTYAVNTASVSEEQLRRLDAGKYEGRP
jgi:hypothetical protein